MDETNSKIVQLEKKLQENTMKLNEDYYINEDGYVVFTEEYHLKRGYCCESGCRHCPYGFKDGKTRVE